MEPITRQQLEKLNKKELVELAAKIKDSNGDGIVLASETKKDVMVQTILTGIEVMKTAKPTEPEPTEPSTEPSTEPKTATEKYPYSLYPNPETVSQEKLEELAEKWHNSPDNVRVVLVDIERKRQEAIAAETREKELAAEVKTSLTEEEKERMTELEAKAAAGRNHPQPADMLWLGRARKRLLITPLNPREARRLAELEADETATLVKPGTPMAAELKSLRQRPE